MVGELSVRTEGVVEKAEELLAGLGSSPGEREREIYEAVCIMGRSPTAVAREFRLAPTTVRNIAQETQRKLARRQHELDRRTTRESLQHYYDIFAMQVDELHDAWRASREESETIQRTTTRSGRPTSPDAVGTGLSAKCEEISEKEATILRKQRVEFRCLALANRIVRDMRAIEAEYKAACAREGSGWRGQEPSERSERADGPDHDPRPHEDANRPALRGANAALLTPPPHGMTAQDRAELAALEATLPPVALGERREYRKVDDGPWEAKTLPVRGKGRMSRRERNKLEREKALARGRQEASQTQAVSAAPQAAGGQGVAAMHVAPHGG